MPKNKKSNIKSAVIFLARYIKPYKWLYFSVTGIAVVLAGICAVQTYITSRLINTASSGGNIGIIGAVFAVLVLINASLTYVSKDLAAKLSSMASRDMKRSVADKLLHAEYRSISEVKAGDAVYTVNTDTENVCAFMRGNMTELFAQIMLLLSALIYVFCIDWRLALVTIAYIPLGMFINIQINKHQQAYYPPRAEKRAEALSVVEQFLTAIPIVKAFVAERYMRRRVLGAYEEVRKLGVKIAFWHALIQPGCSMTSQIPRLIYLLIGGRMVLEGSLSLGVFLAVHEMLTYLIGPCVYFPFILNGLNAAFASMTRISRIEKLPQAEEPKSVQSGKPEIKLDNISFGYNPSAPVIKDYSLDLSGTGLIALTGPSGSGKTTLFDLISGLYRPDSGKITLHGSVAVMSQSSYLFAESLYENVRMVRPDAEDGEVREALRLAGAEDFAYSLPNGVDTLLGDGNTELSGGQRQRVALARAILSGASIWLLDEPTSALDADTERGILEVLKNMAATHLILMTAHRGAAVEAAERRVSL